jgi:antitoxin VapB
MSATAKLFAHERSQAVRLPNEYRFAGREVRVTKVGDRVILKPLAPADAMPWDVIDQLGDTPFMPRGREQPRMPLERVVFRR